MASKHGHGYVTTYRGKDASIKEEFDKITDFAKEMETSYGCLYRDSDSAALAITAAAKVDFNSVYLTSVGTAATGSRDVDASTANDRLAVRYGGMYRCLFQANFTAVIAVVAPIVFQFYIDGAAAGFPFSQPILAATAGTVFHTSFQLPLLFNDRSYVEVFAQSAGAGNTLTFHLGTSLFLIGNRL